MAAEAMTYEGAVERLEEIIRRLDSNQAGLRETLELCQEGKGLIEFAAGELDAVGQGLQELKLDELVARLEAARAWGAAGEPRALSPQLPGFRRRPAPRLPHQPLFRPPRNVP